MPIKLAQFPKKRTSISAKNAPYKLKCNTGNFQCGARCMPISYRNKAGKTAYTNCRKNAEGMAKNGLEWLQYVDSRKGRVEGKFGGKFTTDSQGKIVAKPGVKSKPTATIATKAVTPKPTVDRQVKPSHDLALSSYMDQEMKNFLSKYPKANNMVQGQKRTQLKDKWVEGLKAQAQVGRLPDDVIESYVKEYGMQALTSTFRGVMEKGIQGWVPKEGLKNKSERELEQLEKRIESKVKDGAISQQEYLDGWKEILGDSDFKGMKSGVSNDWYSGIESHLRKGGTITQDIVDSMSEGQRYTWAREFNGGNTQFQSTKTVSTPKPGDRSVKPSQATVSKPKATPKPTKEQIPDYALNAPAKLTRKEYVDFWVKKKLAEDVNSFTNGTLYELNKGRRMSQEISKQQLLKSPDFESLRQQIDDYTVSQKKKLTEQFTDRHDTEVTVDLRQKRYVPARVINAGYKDFLKQRIEKANGMIADGYLEGVKSVEELFHPDVVREHPALFRKKKDQPLAAKQTKGTGDRQPTPTAKQPWEMTSEEYARANYQDFLSKAIKSEERDIVSGFGGSSFKAKAEQRLAQLKSLEGKPYEELAAKYSNIYPAGNIGYEFKLRQVGDIEHAMSQGEKVPIAIKNLFGKSSLSVGELDKAVLLSRQSKSSAVIPKTSSQKQKYLLDPAQLKGDGVLLGSEVIGQGYDVSRYGDGTNAQKRKEYRLRQPKPSEMYDKFGSLSTLRDSQYVLEQRYFGDSDQGRYNEGEWQIQEGYKSMGEAIADLSNQGKGIDRWPHPLIKKIQEIGGKRDQSKKRREETRLTEQKNTVARKQNEYQDWLDNYVPKQKAKAVKGTKQQIELDVRDENNNPTKKSVDATVYGNYAVHRNLAYSPYRKNAAYGENPEYTISDAKSGLQIGNFNTLSDARLAANTMHHEVGNSVELSQLPQQERAKLKEIARAIANRERPNFIAMGSEVKVQSPSKRTTTPKTTTGDRQSFTPTVSRDSKKAPKGYRFTDLEDLQGISVGDEISYINKRKVETYPVEKILTSPNGEVSGITLKTSNYSTFTLMPSDIPGSVVKPVDAPHPTKKNDYLFKGFNHFPEPTPKSVTTETPRTRRGRNPSQELNVMLGGVMRGHQAGKRHEVLSDAKKFAQDKGLEFPDWAQKELSSASRELLGMSPRGTVDNIPEKRTTTGDRQIPKSPESKLDQWEPYLKTVKKELPTGKRDKFGSTPVTIYGNYAVGGGWGNWQVFDANSNSPIIKGLRDKKIAQAATHGLLRVFDGKSAVEMERATSLSPRAFYDAYSKKVDEIESAVLNIDVDALQAITKFN